MPVQYEGILYNATRKAGTGHGAHVILHFRSLTNPVREPADITTSDLQTLR